jgi:hypothetical protein
MRTEKLSAFLLLSGLLVAGCGSSDVQRVVMTEGSSSIPADTCTRFTFQLQTAGGMAATAPAPNGYTMLSFPPTRYADAACTGTGQTLANLTFPAGSSSVTFYIKQSSGNVTYSTEALLTDPGNILSFKAIQRFEFTLNVAR